MENSSISKPKRSFPPRDWPFDRLGTFRFIVFILSFLVGGVGFVLLIANTPEERQPLFLGALLLLGIAYLASPYRLLDKRPRVTITPALLVIPRVDQPTPPASSETKH